MTTDNEMDFTMLVITRKDNEGFWIGSIHVIVRQKGAQTLVMIDGPKDVRVVRDELRERDGWRRAT